jgi:hypothetical protein
MNYFRYKQFNKDVIIVAVGYYLRYAFIKRLIKQFGKPQKIITDQAPSTKVAMAKVIKTRRNSFSTRFKIKVIKMIRKLNKKDQEILKTLGSIWLNSNIATHNFINEEYWVNNYDNVIESFKTAEIIVYEKNTEIIGFCGLIDNYIAGMFIKKSSRNQ